MAISLVLLTGASLFVRSFWKLQNEPLGYEPEHLLTASFTLRAARYGPQASQSPGAISKPGSVRCGPNDQIETHGLGKRPEIPVASKERDPAIDTALGYKGIAQTRLASLRQHFRP